jgi:hypothetical protein
LTFARRLHAHGLIAKTPRTRHWRGTSYGRIVSVPGGGVSATISSTGALAASSLGCNFTGTVVPRPSGKNVFNVAVRFGQAPCELPGQDATGIAVAYPFASGQTQLLATVVDGTRSCGTAAFGVRWSLNLGVEPLLAATTASSSMAEAMPRQA